MPFDTRCPHCDEPFHLADRQRGKKIRCKVCERVFVAADVSRLGESVQESPSSKPAFVPPWKQRDDGDKKDGRRSRKYEQAAPSSANWLLIGGAIGFLVVAALGVGIWVTLRNQDAEDDPPDFRAEVQPPHVLPGPGPQFPGRDPFGRPPQPPEPGVQELSVDELLARARRQDGDPFGDRRQQAMAELARRKEQRGIEPATRLLTDFFQRGKAVETLKAYGKLAEPEVLAYLHHPDDGARGAARDLLKGYGTATDALLTQGLKDVASADRARRSHALAWLAECKPLPARVAEVTQAQEKMLADPDAGLREQAMKGLLAWGSKENTPAVAKAVERGVKETFPTGLHRLAFQALSQWKDARAAPALVQYYGHSFLQGDAEKVLKDIGPPAAKDVVKLMNDPRWQVSPSVRNLLKSYEAPESLLLEQSIEDLKSPDAGRRRFAVEWVAQAKPVEDRKATVARALEALVRDRDGHVQGTAVKALRGWADKDSVLALTAFVEANGGCLGGRGVRALAMETLGELKDARAAAALCGKLVSPFERDTAGKALKAIGSEAEEEVAKYLSNRDGQARAEACRILEVIGTQKSVAALTEAAKGRDIRVTSLAKQALEAIKKKGERGQE